MSLVLEESSDNSPTAGWRSPEAKTFPAGFSQLADQIWVGNLVLTKADFAALVIYVLTNADLAKGDPRIELVETIKRLKIADGFNAGYSRFALEG